MIDRAADARFRKIIKERDGYRCQRCGGVYVPGSPQLECAHIFGRGKPRTRTDPQNAMALCWLCHGHLDTHPKEKEAFFRERLGDEGYEALQRRSNS